MKNKIKSRLTTLLFLTALMTGIFSPISKPIIISASKKAYCAKLNLNNNLKLNKTKTFTKTGIYYEQTLFPTKTKCKIKYTVSCKRKTSKKNYIVTYNVKYKYLDNAKITVTDELKYDDWYWGLTQPHPAYFVFDYQTGMSLLRKNKKNVNVKGSNWKNTYYPKQFYKYTDDLMQEYNEKDLWYINYKNVSCSFTVTYPKTCKDVVIGIGFANTIDYPDSWNNYDYDYFNGKKIAYDKTSYYKKGKDTMSYMRLK